MTDTSKEAVKRADTLLTSCVQYATGTNESWALETFRALSARVAELEEQLVAAERHLMTSPVADEELRKKILDVISFFLHHPTFEGRQIAMTRRANEILSALSR